MQKKKNYIVFFINTFDLSKVSSINKLANDQLNIVFNGDTLNHNHQPKYLGLTLNRTLSLKTHLENTISKFSHKNFSVHLEVL